MIANTLGRVAGNGDRVLDHLYEHPIVSVTDIETLTGTPNQAANDLVARLEGEGILRETTGQIRNRRFRYQSYIDLFSDLLLNQMTYERSRTARQACWPVAGCLASAT